MSEARKVKLRCQTIVPLGPKAGHMSGSVSLQINWVHQGALARGARNRPPPPEYQSCLQKGGWQDDSETQDQVLNSNWVAIPRTNAAT